MAELTFSGGLVGGTVTPRPVAPVPVLLLVTCSDGAAVVPVNVDVALTELLWPRLNTPPTPVPAIATPAASTTAAPTPPANAPCMNRRMAILLSADPEGSLERLLEGLLARLDALAALER